MRRQTAIAALFGLFAITGCPRDFPEISFESGTGDTDWRPVAQRPDLGLAEYEPDQRLDLPKAAGCDQLDMLFVVDNSGSMQDEQAAMLGAVPGFVSEIQELGIGFDLHVGVISTDAYAHNPEGCRKLGALVTSTYLGDCTPYASGQTHMTSPDVDNGAFECAFDIGVSGSTFERAVEGMTRALMPYEIDGNPFGSRGDPCNVGFRRPDAAFVAVILTDEDDVSSNANPDRWRTEIGYLLGQVEQLFIAFIPHEDCDNAEPRNLTEFLESVPSHVAPVCGDYASELHQATLELATTCLPGLPEG